MNGIVENVVLIERRPARIPPHVSAATRLLDSVDLDSVQCEFGLSSSIVAISYQGIVVAELDRVSRLSQFARERRFTYVSLEG